MRKPRQEKSQTLVDLSVDPKERRYCKPRNARNYGCAYRTASTPVFGKSLHSFPKIVRNKIFTKNAGKQSVSENHTLRLGTRALELDK